jgi:hypothetical protein
MGGEEPYPQLSLALLFGFVEMSFSFLEIMSTEHQFNFYILHIIVYACFV